MKLRFDISKKYSLMLVGLLVLIGVVSLGVAYGTTTPAVFGHSAGEIEGGSGGGGVPSGTIALFDGACPSGWTHFAELDDRFPLGSSAANLGGADGQSVWTSDTGKTSLIPIRGVDGVDGGDANAGSYPNTYLQVPYKKVVYCEKTSGGTGGGSSSSSGVSISDLRDGLEYVEDSRLAGKSSIVNSVGSVTVSCSSSEKMIIASECSVKEWGPVLYPTEQSAVGKIVEGTISSDKNELTCNGLEIPQGYSWVKVKASITCL
jgi:hypothetical protein